jgi:hypothetical protein
MMTKPHQKTSILKKIAMLSTCSTIIFLCTETIAREKNTTIVQQPILEDYNCKVHCNKLKDRKTKRHYKKKKTRGR